MNYYEILGVTPDSDMAEIKSAYRKLARQFHPDVNPGGARHFKDISAAYDTLSDPELRKQYDILNGIFKSRKAENTDFTNNNFTERKTETQRDTGKQTEQQKPKRKQKNFSDVLNSFFESNTEDKVPVDGDDINADVTISISEAFRGASKTVNVMHTELCPRCKGRKFINGTKCNVCGGTGEYCQRKRINVQIPKGVKQGAKLRLKGEGNKGVYGGKNGDLYLHVLIEENSRIKYDNLNILYNLPITPYEAVLGAELTIPVPDGSVRLKLPERTLSGQKFRIAGQGLTKNGKSGDIIVTVSIEIPKCLSDDEVKLYEKLKKLSSDNIRENLLDG